MLATYGFGASLPFAFEEAVQRVKAALKAEGFGVLSEIDVRQTLQEKLNIDMGPYVILGACNPPLAHRALSVEPEIGLMLPCNVIVRVEGKTSRVDIADPQVMLGIVGKEQLRDVADEARQRLLRVLAALQDAK
ncbi:MAG TPA: DUF302 domain-containing protein [Ktedonobacteraceae bacterium]|nr:DUF302 domain-containing protein [Ktedonobacteraceae bacterium]